MRVVQRGLPVEPYFGIGFAEVGAMLTAFTPRRWELIAALREHGPMSVAELARQIGRNSKNADGDVVQLIEWMAVERVADGGVHAPWSEIVLEMKLPEQVAA